MSAVLDVLPVSADRGSDHSGVPVSMVERMTLILELFQRPQTRLTLEKVVARTNLPRSTAHRILDQLIRANWVTHSASGYRLGPRALSLGGRDVGYGPVRAAAAPRLHELYLRTGLVAHLAVLDRIDTVYLDKVGGREAADMVSRVGGRAPAHRTASGRAILAWLSPEQLDVLFDFEVVAERHLDMSRLTGELNAIRQRKGLAFVRNFFGTTSVALAIRGMDGPIASVSLSGPPDRPLERVVPLLVEAVHGVAGEIAMSGR